jgi:uncharacterized protein (TIGR00251 family)
VVRVVPRAGRDGVEAVADTGVLRVRVVAAPTDGSANRSLVRLLARTLDVPPSAVRIEAGERSRTKRIAVDGVPASHVAARWPGLRVAES